MGRKTERPALVQSAGHRARIDIPARKFDNDKHISFDCDSKAAPIIDRIARSADSCPISGGYRLRFEYLDKHGEPLAPGYRVYSSKLNGDPIYEFTPIEDAVLFSAPGHHERRAYDVARLNNAFARTEWRRVYGASFKGTCVDLGFASERELEAFVSYLFMIEDDDHAVLREFGFDPAVAVPAYHYRDPTLVFSDVRLWWRVSIGIVTGPRIGSQKEPLLLVASGQRA